MGPGEEEALAALRENFPQAATAELLRFARARRHSLAEARRMYQAHLEWRRGPGASERLAGAARAVPAKFVRAAGMARDGSPLVVVQGARFDPSVDSEQYVLAVAKVLDELASPADMTKVTGLVDCRPIEGCPNTPARKMLPFFRSICRVLPNQFPERLRLFVIYPMPDFVYHLWQMCSHMLDQVTRDKLVVLYGPSNRSVSCPDRLGDYVALDQLPVDLHASHQALASEPRERTRPPHAADGPEDPDGAESFYSARSRGSTPDLVDPDPADPWRRFLAIGPFPSRSPSSTASPSPRFRRCC